MKKTFCIGLSIIFFSCTCFAQKISINDLKALKKKEDSLKTLAFQIIQGRTSEDRFRADSQFTKMFVRALKINNSFQYPFDSLITISRLAPPDSTFKIFTWQMVINDNVVRQHGAIQMHTKDGSLKLFPLIDKSDVTVDMKDTVGNNFGWIGAVYYHLIEKQAAGKNYYTLLGYDENNINSNKKLVEVLTFENGEPIFGGPYFSVQNNEVAKNFGSRFIMQYKKGASPRLSYDEDQDMIIFENLIPEPGSDPNKKFSYVGDGDYDGLQWKNGKWVHIEKVYTQQTKEGQEPVPSPIRDANGNIDYSKLKNNGAPADSDDNTQQAPEKKVTKTKTKTPKK